MEQLLSFFLDKLDWYYIGSVIAISYFLNKDGVISGLPNSWARTKLLAVPTVWRTFTIGLIWMVIIFWLRDYQLLPGHGKAKFEDLLSSLFTAMVGYQLFLKKYLDKISSNDGTGS